MFEDDSLHWTFQTYYSRALRGISECLFLVKHVRNNKLKT